MSCWWSQCTGVTGGVMQIMAAIMTVGALCARWSVVEENGDSHLFASEVHVGGVSSQSWAEVVTQSCNDDTSDLCSAAKSAKTTFGALFFVGCVLCAVDIVLWFIGDLAWKFQVRAHTVRVRSCAFPHVGHRVGCKLGHAFRP